MTKNLCRFCLNSNNLSSIFMNLDELHIDIVILSQITGLKIELDDGLPEHLCIECKNTIKNTIIFRHKCHDSERKLIQIQNEPKHTNLSVNERNSNDFETEMMSDFSDFIGITQKFKVDVEFDRLQDGVNFEFAQTASSVQPKSETVFKPNTKPVLSKQSTSATIEENTDKDNTRNPNGERRKELLGLVEGSFVAGGPVKCRVCKKVLSKWTCFVNHAKLHLGFKFICEFCGKRFISSFQLKRHCMSHHGLKRQLKCKHCDYLALDSSQLTVHERHMHTGERPFVCDECSASYFSRKCLLQHIETHRTINTVRCDFCPQLFKSNRHLSKHKHASHSAKKKRKSNLL